MLDLIVRAITWMLGLCTPTPSGRHRLGALPPLRIAPAPPPPLFTELIDGNASHLVRPYVLAPEELRRRRERLRAAYLPTPSTGVELMHTCGTQVAAATR